MKHKKTASQRGSRKVVSKDATQGIPLYVDYSKHAYVHRPKQLPRAVVSRLSAKELRHCKKNPIYILRSLDGELIDYGHNPDALRQYCSDCGLTLYNLH